jgi:hypothetical protein
MSGSVALEPLCSWDGMLPKRTVVRKNKAHKFHEILNDKEPALKYHVVKMNYAVPIVNSASCVKLTRRSTTSVVLMKKWCIQLGEFVLAFKRSVGTARAGKRGQNCRE